MQYIQVVLFLLAKVLNLLEQGNSRQEAQQKFETAF